MAMKLSTCRHLLAVFLIVGLGVAVASRGVHAFSIEFQGRQVKRTLLALYDAKTEESLNRSRLHKLAEMPLNHLGYQLEFHDIRSLLPPVASLARFRGIVTWFVEELPDPAGYLAWLDEATASGLKLVALGEVAPRESDELVPALNRVLGRIGLRSASVFHELTYKAKVVEENRAVIGFEQKLDKVLPGFPVIDIVSQNARSHLSIEIATSLGRVLTHPVTTSDQGGYAAQNYTVSLDPNTDRLGWILNPFQFFKLALGDERFPIPDVTTVSGRRIYFSHIDGDGWNNLTEVEVYRGHEALSVEVVTREAIEAYPDLPVSVGLIAADVQPLLGGNAAGARWARRLFALPHVEVASHTHTHPYNWQFFERYDRKSEEQLIAGYRPPDMPLRERLTAAMMKAAGRRYANPRFDPFVAGTDDLPRTYLREPFDLQREVFGALRISEQFAPAGKRAMLYMWSGDTTPFEGAVAATREARVRNLNGGDSRLDREYPSVAYVPPISRQIGRQRQIYAVNSNENTYTNDWTGPFGGQMMLAHTLRNTEQPRRLKGFNLYYHMYSGEKPASLAAIRHYLEMARTAPVIPIEASSYAALADDYFGVTIEQVDLFSWAIRSRGSLNTMRFDEADKLAVDLVASTGVLGSTRVNGSLYVTLDGAVDRPVVTLIARSAEDARPDSGEHLASLSDSRWRLSRLQRGVCWQSYVGQGYGPAEMTFDTVPNRGMKLRAERRGVLLAEELRWADGNGRVRFSMAVDGIEPVDLVLSCHD